MVRQIEIGADDPPGPLMRMLLAAALGLVLGIFWIEVQFPAILGWNLEPHFPLAFALVTALATTAVCLSGSMLSSLRATRLSVPGTLRNE